jgi:hypothetical protein
MRYLKFALLLSVVFVAAGCTDAFWASAQALGAKHRVELWSGGQLVHEWTSTGKVLNERESDGYYFCDEKTKRLVRVTGDLVITVID